ncbi:MAG: sugar phosphate isomerase/epimerase [Actinomycetales bacterium]|nr:sugar phosphate isomerase/epimerase [Actinomycetales bacterium]
MSTEVTGGAAVVDVPSGRPATTATPRPGDPRLARFSLNQRTVPRLSVPDLVETCLAAGVGAVGLWREPVAEHGLAETARLVRRAGLRVSSLCRGGFLTAADQPGRRAAVEDNRRAIEEAATLGADCLVLVVGGMSEGSRDLAGARERVREVLAVLAPEAAAAGVRLAVEPLHPMYVADRAVVSTLDQALDLAAPYPADVLGVVVDAYHLWWDPRLPELIRRAGPRIASYQVCDWVLPLAADVLLARGVMGDGVIDLAGMAAEVEAAGYTGDVEVEIFNAEVWAAEPRAVLDTVLRRYVTCCLPPRDDPAAGSGERGEVDRP